MRTIKNWIKSEESVLKVEVREEEIVITMIPWRGYCSGPFIENWDEEAVVNVVDIKYFICIILLLTLLSWGTKWIKIDQVWLLGHRWFVVSKYLVSLGVFCSCN